MFRILCSFRSDQIKYWNLRNPSADLINWLYRIIKELCQMTEKNTSFEWSARWRAFVSTKENSHIIEMLTFGFIIKRGSRKKWQSVMEKGKLLVDLRKWTQKGKKKIKRLWRCLVNKCWMIVVWKRLISLLTLSSTS